VRIIHLSDLHLGKRVNEYSMLEDQRYILDEIIGIIEESKPQAVVIAGDVYDKPTPPAEAVQLFDCFISRLEEMQLEVFVISGNHDSAERLSFASSIMDKRGIHFAGRYDGLVSKVVLSDEYGDINFYMLPFIKPVHVRAAFADEEPAISSYDDALRYAVERMDVDTSSRNVLIAHQFVTGAETCESEELSAGGLDNVDASIFERFDYTALGHLHGPQDIVKGRIRYCGTPLKYSFSEVNHRKSVTVVDMGPKGDVSVTTRELRPLRDMQVLKSEFSKLTDKTYYEEIDTDNYMRIILTDEEDVIGALSELRAIYPNIMRLEYDNARTRAQALSPDTAESDSRTPLEIFAGLYEAQNGKPMSDEQTALVTELIDKVWGSDK
jgi:exonuclease SbcD